MLCLYFAEWLVHRDLRRKSCNLSSCATEDFATMTSPEKNALLPPNSGRKRPSRHSQHIADVPVAFVVSPLLTDAAERVRDRPIPWEGYVRAGLITDHQLGMLRSESPQDIVKVSLELLSSLARIDTLQAVLVRMDDLLDKDRSLACTLYSLRSLDPKLPLLSLANCLDKEDSTTALFASKILTFLVCMATECSIPDPIKNPEQRESVVKLLNYLVQRLTAPSKLSVKFLPMVTTTLDSPTSTSSISSVDAVSEISVQLLGSALQVASLRREFYNIPGSVPALLDLIRRAQGNPQLLYECCLCLWELSYDSFVAARIDRDYDVIPLLIDTAKAAIKEKVVRVCIATLRNLAEKAIDANVGSMLVHKLLPCCESLATRKFNDEDIPNDLQAITEALSENFQRLSSFDAYVTEVESKKLDWTPAHQSDEFWKQYASKLDERDHAILRMLTNLVKSDVANPTVLAVACNDLGQYVKFHPTGKKMVDKLGAKERIMQLMTHEDAEVKYQALLAVQKYMVHAWD